MFGSIGGAEIVLILGLALLLFGPRRLPDIGRQIGRTLGEFRKAASDFKQDLEREVRTEEVRETGGALKAIDREIDQNLQPAPPPRAADASPGTVPPVADGPDKREA